MSAEPAELPTVETDDRDDVIARVRAAAFDEGRDCEYCQGTGHVPTGGRRLVHSVAGPFGADWDEDAIVELVQRSSRIAWGPGFDSHDLAVFDPTRMNGQGSWVKFQVRHPQRPPAEDAS